MAALTPDQLETLVAKVAERLGSATTKPAPRVELLPAWSRVSTAGRARAPAFLRNTGHMLGRGMFADLDSAVSAAQRAFEQLRELDLAVRARMIEAMRRAHLDATRELAAMAVQETGLGRVEDKILKNTVAAQKTPGLEILVPRAFTGDDGLTLHERAPFGVIGSITPCTNPTETVVNNAISMVTAGNSVVFNVHPNAKNVCRRNIELLNDAIVAAGGPENCVCGIAEPTVESAQALMKHPGIRVVVVTGGGAVVKAAMASGKRAICAGPGNPPVVVDETAHLDQAARDVVAGASIDNNIICIVEKECFAVASIADALKAGMQKNGAVEVSGAALRRLEQLVVTSDGHTNRDWIGKDAAKILRAAGVSCADETRLAFAEVDAAHPFVQLELLMPVLPVVRVKDWETAIDEAVRAEHGFFHTAVMHSTNIDRLHEMARAVNTSIFIKNAPSYAGLGVGGEGYTAWTIAGASGDGLTTALTYTRERRCTLKDKFRIV